jgi:hypothetical protein
LILPAVSAPPALIAVWLGEEKIRATWTTI